MRELSMLLYDLVNTLRSSSNGSARLAISFEDTKLNCLYMYDFEEAFPVHIDIDETTRFEDVIRTVSDKGFAAHLRYYNKWYVAVQLRNCLVEMHKLLYLQKLYVVKADNHIIRGIPLEEFCNLVFPNTPRPRFGYLEVAGFLNWHANIFKEISSTEDSSHEGTEQHDMDKSHELKKKQDSEREDAFESMFTGESTRTGDIF